MTAKEARYLTGFNFERKAETQVGRIYNAIKAAIKRGEDKILLYEDLDNYSKHCLKEDGYMINEFSIHLTGVWVLEVKW